MAHVRQQIREAIGSFLLNNTNANANVFQSRTEILGDYELPAVLIMTLNETSQVIDIGPNPRYERVLNVDLNAYHKVSSNVDDAIDTLSQQIETILGNNPRLGGIATNTVMVGTAIEFDETGESPIAKASLQYTVTYYTRAASPDVSI